MKIVIIAQPKEIAALISAIQERQNGLTMKDLEDLAEERIKTMGYLGDPPRF